MNSFQGRGYSKHTTATMLLRPCLRSAGRAVRIQRRYKHTIPSLQNGVSNETGVPGLFSAPGFQMGWSKYQSFLLDKLNQFTDGMLSLSLKIDRSGFVLPGVGWWHVGGVSSRADSR